MILNRQNTEIKKLRNKLFKMNVRSGCSLESNVSFGVLTDPRQTNTFGTIDPKQN